MAAILDGVRDIKTRVLPVCKHGYDNPKYLEEVGNEPLAVDWLLLVDALGTKIAKNWDQRACSGQNNWRLRQALDADPKNGPEVLAERAIAGACGWHNQLSVSSGVGDGSARRRCVDLARLDRRRLELVELKVLQQTNNALFAALEVLDYGLLYMFSRAHHTELGYTRVTAPLLFDVDLVELKVLAPEPYYPTSAKPILRGVERGLNEAFAACVKKDYSVTFSFEQFSANITESTFRGGLDLETCRRAMDGRRPVFG